VTRHRLSPAARAGDPLEVARSVVCLHATDAVTVFLAIQARSECVAPADVERALYEERSLVRMLAMRRTLWGVPRELVPVVFAAATRAVAATQRKRLEGFVRDSGVSTRPGAWITRAGNAAVAAVAARGEAMTAEISKDVPLLAKKLRFGTGKWVAEQSAGARVLPQMAMEGRLVRGRPRGSWISPQFRWVTTEDWLGGPIEELDVAGAQAELLRAWLAAFGPATEADMRWWTGWTLRETRSALAATPHAQVELDGAAGYVLADDLEPTPRPEPSAALLPTLDPTTMGWKERDWYLGPHGPTLFDSNGNAGPTIWWDGRIVGGWSQRRDGEIVFGLLEDVGSDARAAIDAEADRLAAWVGDVRFSPGFLPPFQRGLAGT
jgi:Winged helix DNA-binding domain